jgi:putative transposase
MLNRRYETDLTDAAWALAAPLLPAAKAGGRPRTTDLRAVLHAIFYRLRSGCQGRLLPREFPPWGTVYYYFRSWDQAGVWVHMQRALYEQVRVAAGRETCPSVVLLEGPSVKTTGRGGMRGFAGYKRVQGRKRHIWVDPLGLRRASRIEPANTSDQRAGARLPSGGKPLFPRIRTVIADAGQASRQLARESKRDEGWKLQSFKRRQRAFQITGLTWIGERTFAWLGRNRRFRKGYEDRVQTSETLLDIAAIRIMLNRLAPA